MQWVQLITTNVQMLLFVDEIVMVTEKDDMQRNLDEVKKVMDKWGMKMHWGKTKVIIVSRTERSVN